MPIYEYKCEKCTHLFEKLQKISDQPLTLCPQCNKEGLTKLVSTGGILKLGHGWYDSGMSASSRKGK